MLDARTYKTDDIVRIYNEARLGDYLVVQCDRVNAADARSQRFFFHEREGSGAPARRLAQRGDPRPQRLDRRHPDER